MACLLLLSRLWVTFTKRTVAWDWEYWWSFCYYFVFDVYGVEKKKKISDDKIVEFNACKQKILEPQNMELTLSIKEGSEIYKYICQ